MHIDDVLTLAMASKRHMRVAARWVAVMKKHGALDKELDEDEDSDWNDDEW